MLCTSCGIFMKAETFFYLQTRGRHSGMKRQLEVWFVELTDVFYLLAVFGEHADWIKNIEAHPEVSFSIGNRKNEASEVGQTDGRGRVVDDVTESELCAQVRSALHAKYRWTAGTIVEVRIEVRERTEPASEPASEPSTQPLHTLA